MYKAIFLMETLYLFIFIASERLSRQSCLSILTVTAYLMFVFNSVNIAAKEKYLKYEKNLLQVFGLLMEKTFSTISLPK